MKKWRAATLLSRAGGASIVNPATISGATAWWKASSIAQADSSAVTTWTDSISSIAPTQATAGNKPTYRTTAGPNSLPCVSFDGGDWINVSVTGSQIWAANQCHIFFVIKQTAADAQNCPMAWLGAGSNAVEAFLSYDDVLYFDFGGTGAAGTRVSVAQPTGWDDNWHIVELVREPPDSGTGRIFVDGVERVNGAITVTIGLATGIQLIFGAQTTGGAIGFTGFITDILMYNVALSTANRQAVETYFNSLYTIF